MFRDELDEDVRFLIVSKMKSFPRQQLLGKTWFRVLRTNPFDMHKLPMDSRQIIRDLIYLRRLMLQF